MLFKAISRFVRSVNRPGKLSNAFKTMPNAKPINEAGNSEFAASSPRSAQTTDKNFSQKIGGEKESFKDFMAANKGFPGGKSSFTEAKEGREGFKDNKKFDKKEYKPESSRENNQGFNKDRFSDREGFRNDKGSFRDNKDSFKHEKKPYYDKSKNEEAFGSEMHPGSYEKKSFRDDKGYYKKDNQSFRNEKGSYRNDKNSFRKDKRSFREDKDSFRNDKGSFKNNNRSFNSSLKSDRESFKDDRKFNNTDKKSYRNQKNFGKHKDTKLSYKENSHSFTNLREIHPQSNKSFHNDKSSFSQTKSQFKDKIKHESPYPKDPSELPPQKPRNFSTSPDSKPFKTSPRSKSQPSDFPEELKKVGISPNKFDKEMLGLYKTMKAQGADKLAEESVNTFLKEGETPEEIMDKVFSSKSGVPQGDVNSLFPGKQSFERLNPEEELPEPIQGSINQELKQYDLKQKLYKEKDLATAAKDELKGIIKKDIEEAEDSKKDREFGWLDKVKVKESHSKEFDEMVASWPKVQQKVFEEMEAVDDKRLYKENKKFDKIKQKRAIRDKYNEFKIPIEDDKVEKNDYYIDRSSKFIMDCLNDILTENQQYMAEEVLQGGIIAIHDIKVSKSLSVITVFFEVTFLDLIKEPDFNREKVRIEEVKKKLVHAEPFLRGKLTQLAGLKYAPELRFIPYKLGGSQKQAIVGIEDNSQVLSRMADKEPEEMGDILDPKAPSKRMKKYYKTIEQRKNSNPDK